MFRNHYQGYHQSAIIMISLSNIDEISFLLEPGMLPASRCYPGFHFSQSLQKPFSILPPSPSFHGFLITCFTLQGFAILTVQILP